MPENAAVPIISHECYPSPNHPVKRAQRHTAHAWGAKRAPSGTLHMHGVPRVRPVAQGLRRQIVYTNSIGSNVAAADRTHPAVKVDELGSIWAAGLTSVPGLGGSGEPGSSEESSRGSSGVLGLPEAPSSGAASVPGSPRPGRPSMSSVSAAVGARPVSSPAGSAAGGGQSSPKHTAGAAEIGSTAMTSMLSALLMGISSCSWSIVSRAVVLAARQSSCRPALESYHSRGASGRRTLQQLLEFWRFQICRDKHDCLWRSLRRM